MAELLLLMLLLTTAKDQHNVAAAAATAMEESVRQDRGRSSSCNADYNSFGPAQKLLSLRLLNFGMSSKDTALQIAQERNRAIVDEDNDATVEDNQCAANNVLRLRSPRHPDDEDTNR
jgi:hypothetical protein